ncbi:MAG: hypothetical protein DMF69_23235 [Acidobacteria bacterium]|nr:MAG: hypothetical protein DMF69_23235 [Acidobacteriota bacterium]
MDHFARFLRACKATYHLDGAFPDELEIGQSYVHTGMFLGWISDHDLYSEFFGQEFYVLIAAFKARNLTGAKVFEACHGVLTDEMLSVEGNKFAQDYFDFDRDKYQEDYNDLLCKELPSMYHVADTWPNYEMVKHMIDKRYLDWKRRRRPWRAIFRKYRVTIVLCMN